MKRMMLCVGCAALLLVSWLVAVTAKSDGQRQLELIQRAETYLEDEVYILSVPLLEEAAGYKDDYTLRAEELLKTVYLHLLDQSGYRGKYEDLLRKQMDRKDAAPEVFEEAARYYLDGSEQADAFAVLREGIERTGSQALTELYESTRYAYTLNSSVYQDVTEIFDGSIQVKTGTKWGIASADGSLTIPCVYEWVSTFSGDRAIVRSGGVISAVDGDNNRVALFRGEASDIGNYADNRVGLKGPNGWVLSDGEFQTGSVLFEALGMFSDGYAAAKQNGKWGVIDSSGGEWLIPPDYEGIIQDELGRCYAQGAVFVVEAEEQVRLLVDGNPVGEYYEDARPFRDGWAAVKRDGKWGFIDVQGNVQIDFQFDDAQSFGQHLAAVRQGEYWGYLSLRGEVVIKPVFLEARSFSGGSAPVRTVSGWQFITLTEYEEGVSL